ncbi:hypothetical protein [Thiocapsa sp. UBA6158]|uniref:hypothetical protein n=1 Tax=Thiocapsa sp. UBA6158 TaxID=1947692 RepID=UPI0025E56E10|nr:hypothetical protein [Thiocapsa sp. UBA6158]
MNIDRAEAFFAETVEIDTAPLQTCLIAHVQSGGHLLGTGFGSGRDDPATRRTVLRRFDFIP